MAITSSAKKAIRVSAKKRIFNLRRKVAMDDIAKKVVKLAKAGKAKDAIKLMSLAYKAIDKSAKTKFIKKNTADRMKSRLTIFVNKQ